MSDTIGVLFQRIKKARHCVALTGAGVSTLSGIRDFRGKNGLYNAGPTGQPEAEKIFDLEYFEQDPSFYYKAAGSFVYNINEKEPSVVHRVLAALEQRGLLKALITQNIDLLHQKGGSRRVIEVHGSPQIHYCLHCAGVRMDFEEAAAIVHSGALPRCPRCNRVLKPAITFFGESLPMEALRDAGTEAQNADLMLVLGTSLTVNPAASLPDYTLRNGGDVVIVNNQSTRLDGRAVQHFADLGEVFEGLQKLLNERR
ncbi:MAG: NAD-dependent deacetylase [Treponema sp.]|jgi:NAD-dependent deacetylase|nr:NAD-dependent deacetylase [Treponema sp.]